jgi:AraC-like DNA-binding protein
LESVALLMESLEHKKPAGPRQILIPPELVVRRSSLKRSLGTMHDGAFRERAYEYIEAHFADTRAMRRIHDSFGLGREHFQTRFKRAFGRSMVDLLGAYRLAKAAQRLRYGNEPIIEIYLECGFGTHQHFISMFRRSYGVTPSAFRARHPEGRAFPGGQHGIL